jgi:hypothetical protein
MQCYQSSITCPTAPQYLYCLSKTQNQYIFFLNSVNDNRFSDWKTPQAWAQFLIAAAADVWMIGKEIKSIR